MLSKDTLASIGVVVMVVLMFVYVILPPDIQFGIGLIVGMIMMLALFGVYAYAVCSKPPDD